MTKQSNRKAPENCGRARYVASSGDREIRRSARERSSKPRKGLSQIPTATVALLAAGLIRTVVKSDLSSAFLVATSAAAVVQLARRMGWAVSSLIFAFLVPTLSVSSLAPAFLVHNSRQIVLLFLIPTGILALRRLERRQRSLFLAVLGVSLPAVLSSLMLQDIGRLYGAVSVLLLSVCVFALAATSTAEHRRSISIFLVALSVIEVAIAVLQVVFPVAVIRGATATPGQAFVNRPNELWSALPGRAQGTLGYPIMLAGLLLVAFALVVSFSYWSAPVRAMLVVVLLAGILLSGTRSALPGVLLIIATAIWTSRRGGPSGARLAIVGAIVLAGYYGLSAFFSKHSLASDYSVTHRFGIVERAGLLLNRDPFAVIFGSGFDSHEQFFRSGVFEGQHTEAVDNMYMTLLIYGGICALVAMCLTLLMSIRGGHRWVGALAGLGTWLFFFDGILWHMGLTLTFFVVGSASAAADEGLSLDGSGRILDSEVS